MADTRHKRRGHAAKRRRLTTLAVGSAVVLVTAALLVAREDAQQQRAQAPTARNPEIIRIQRPEHADLVLERDNNTWQITAPCALLVNQQRLSPLLEALNTPAASYSAAEVDTEAAGLDAPLATLVLDDESIIIGGVDVSGARRYVQSADRVELVPEWILSLVGGGLSAFASNDVFAGKVTQVLIAERALDVDAVGAWNGLSSGQTIEWPLKDVLPPDSFEIDASITLANGTTHKVQVTGNAEWQALVLDGAGCARLLPADTLATVLPSSNG